jgi:TerC family integral membrane protein
MIRSAFAPILAAKASVRGSFLGSTCRARAVQASHRHSFQQRRTAILRATQDAPPAALNVTPLSSGDSGGDDDDVAKPPTMAKDIAWTVAWVAVAAATAGGFGYFEGSQRALEFVAGYLIEYSLSVDNLFVFLLIFNNFKVPRKSQERVLNYGIISAFVLRGAMILVGAELTRRFKFVTLGFAGLLLFSGAKLFLEDEDEDGDLEDDAIVKLSRKLLPFSGQYDGENFFTRENGKKLATPLMLVLLCIELSDVVFALDSVPAVLGISTDTKVVYLSNILAIVGLRNLYFILASALGDLRFLRPALGVLLTFVGGKMGAETLLEVDIGIVPSLGVIASVLGGGIGLSLAFPEPKEDAN